jgi:DNA polymerase III alpha subunit
MLEQFLKETYCVIVYQEQVMEIAQALSGFSSDEADNFRKAMSSGKSDIAKGFNPFVKYEKRFIDGCRRKGINERIAVVRTIYSDSDIPSTAKDVVTTETGVDDKGLPFRKISCTVEVADELFYQIKSFAEYGFNKSHAVEYSQLAVYCMYFKHYYPIEFVASILSNTPNAINPNDKSNKFVDYFFEAKKMKVKVLPPDINESDIRFIPKKDHVLSGFNFIKDLSEEAMNAIIKKRPFTSFKDFVSKVSTKEVNKSSMLALIHSGCFDKFLEINGDKKKLNLRYDLVQEYVAMRKVKDLDVPKEPTAVDAILEESEYCGDQIFNSLIELIDKEVVSAKYSIDDKIMPFSSLEKMNVGTTIRVFGVVNSWFVKTNHLTGNSVGFLNVKNGSKMVKFICWSNDIDKIERVDAIKAMLKPKSVITFRTRRERDYKENKSFLLLLDGMEKLL